MSAKGETLRTVILVLAILIGLAVQAPEASDREAVALGNSPTVAVEPLPTL